MHKVNCKYYHVLACLCEYKNDSGSYYLNICYVQDTLLSALPAPEHDALWHEFKPSFYSSKKCHKFKQVAQRCLQ